jgi:hypothetical protein
MVLSAIWPGFSSYPAKDILNLEEEYDYIVVGAIFTTFLQNFGANPTS